MEVKAVPLVSKLIVGILLILLDVVKLTAAGAAEVDVPICSFAAPEPEMVPVTAPVARFIFIVPPAVNRLPLATPPLFIFIMPVLLPISLGGV